jgi:hypothetical protein
MQRIKNLATAWKSWFTSCLLALLISILCMPAPVIAAPIMAPNQTKQNQANVQDSTSSDLSDIPNLEQMDHGKLERYFGDLPNGKKPLFNPDNGKNQQLQDPESDQTIRIKDLKDESKPD